MKHKVIASLFTIMFVASLILAWEGLPITCDGGCDLVKISPYSQTFGIYNAYYGVAIFAFLTIFTILHIKNPRKERKIFIDLAAILGAAIALRFIYLQVFVIQAYCFYCMIVDIALIITAIIVLFWDEEANYLSKAVHQI